MDRGTNRFTRPLGGSGEAGVNMADNTRRSLKLIFSCSAWDAMARLMSLEDLLREGCIHNRKHNYGAYK